MHSKYSWAFVLFFLGMALLVPVSMQYHLGVGGLFFAMIGAVAGTGGIVFGGRALVRRWRRNGVGMREMGSFLLGEPDLPPYVIDALPERTALLPARGQQVSRDEVWDDEEEWDDEDDEIWNDEEDEEWNDEDDNPLLPSYQPFADEMEDLEPWDEEPNQKRTASSRVDLLDLAPNFQADPNDLCSTHVLVAGLPGSGKTNTVRRLLEQCAERGLPFLLVDTDGEYDTLLPLLPRGMVAGQSNRYGLVQTQYAEVSTKEAAQRFGSWLLEHRRQVVLDVKSYSDPDGTPDEDVAASMLIEIVRGMRAWEETHDGARIPCAVILEEAQVWLPQDYRGSTLSEQSLRMLRKLFVRSARDGRRRGIGLVLVAHRIAGILKDVLMTDWMILHAPQRTDYKRYRELAPDVPKERFTRLSRGRAVVLTPQQTYFEVKFHRAVSQDRGRSPNLTDLRRGAGQHASQPFRQETGTGQLPAHPVAFDQETILLPESIPTLPPLTPSIPVLPDKGPRAEDIDLVLAIDLWNKGYNGPRKLMRVFRITFYQACRLRDLIVAQGQAQPEEQE